MDRALALRRNEKQRRLLLYVERSMLEYGGPGWSQSLRKSRVRFVGVQQLLMNAFLSSPKVPIPAILNS